MQLNNTTKKKRLEQLKCLSFYMKHALKSQFTTECWMTGKITPPPRLFPFLIPRPTRFYYFHDKRSRLNAQQFRGGDTEVGFACRCVFRTQSLQMDGASGLRADVAGVIPLIVRGAF